MAGRAVGGVLGALAGVVAGAGLGLGGGLLYTEAAGTTGFEGYSGFVVVYWLIGGAILGLVGGAVFGASRAT